MPVVVASARPRVSDPSSSKSNAISSLEYNSPSRLSLSYNRVFLNGAVFSLSWFFFFSDRGTRGGLCQAVQLARRSSTGGYQPLEVYSTSPPFNWHGHIRLWRAFWLDCSVSRTFSVWTLIVTSFPGLSRSRFYVFLEGGGHVVSSQASRMRAAGELVIFLRE